MIDGETETTERSKRKLKHSTLMSSMQESRWTELLCKILHKRMDGWMPVWAIYYKFDGTIHYTLPCDTMARGACDLFIFV